jgi:hypothetical protein
MKVVLMQLLSLLLPQDARAVALEQTGTALHVRSRGLLQQTLPVEILMVDFSKFPLQDDALMTSNCTGFMACPRWVDLPEKELLTFDGTGANANVTRGNAAPLYGTYALTNAQVQGVMAKVSEVKVRVGLRTITSDKPAAQQSTCSGACATAD